MGERQQALSAGKGEERGRSLGVRFHLAYGVAFAAPDWPDLPGGKPTAHWLEKCGSLPVPG